MLVEMSKNGPIETKIDSFDTNTHGWQAPLCTGFICHKRLKCLEKGLSIKSCKKHKVKKEINKNRKRIPLGGGRILIDV